MNTYLVSVVIPSYNHARFLEKRIESILNQTYQDFEIIILDDCSPDGGASRKVIEKYRGNSRVSHIIYNEKNSGSTFIQWKKGFEIARGKYIWIAESDDMADSTMLEKFVSELEHDDKTVLVFSKLRFIDENGEEFEFEQPVKYATKQKIENLKFIKKHMIQNNSIYNASGVVFRKSTLSGIDYDFMNYKAAGDYLFWLELLHRKGNVVFLPEKLDFFRRHNNTVTSNSKRSTLEASELKKIFDKLVIWGYVNRTKQFLITGQRLLHYNITEEVQDIEIRNKCLSIWSRETMFPSLNIWGFRLYNRLAGVVQRWLNHP